MPTVTGTFQFPSVIPRGFLFYFLRRLKKEEVIEKKATPLIFLRNEIYIYIYVYVCVCMYSMYYFVMNPIIFFPPKFAVIFSPEGAFWLL